ncbi:MAG: Fur family transcriptional regulator [Desulfovibrionales bacterium]
MEIKRQEHALKSILEDAGVVPNRNRVLVLGEIAASDKALSVPELLQRLSGKDAMNKVTLYRILDLFIRKKIVLRHSVGDRAYRYCLGCKGGPGGHCHFFCTVCGRTECIGLGSLSLDLNRVQERTGRQVDKMEVRLDGICRYCKKED